MYPHVPKFPLGQPPQRLQRFSGLWSFIFEFFCRRNISPPPEKTKIPLSQNVIPVFFLKKLEKEKPQPKTISELVFIGISEKGIHDFFYPY